MDRLSIVIVLLAACGKDDVAPPPARAESAKVEKKQVSVDAFCDRHLAGDSGPSLTFPPLVGAAPPATPGHWRWLNVWATWCKPCIAEMPRITAQRDRLVAAGKRVAPTFVSTDDSDAEVAEFRKAHPELPASLRIAGNNQRMAWLRSLHLSDGAIPINLFVSPAGRLRCARAGEIREQDLAMVDRLLAE